MNPEKQTRQPDEDQTTHPAQEGAGAPGLNGSSGPAAPAADAAAASKYVFKIVRADPKNDFDFENVADK